MLGSLALSLAVFFGGPALIVAIDPSLRRRSFLTYPVCAAVFFTSLGLVGALLGRRLGYGVWPLAVVITVALGVTWGMLQWVRPAELIRTREDFGARTLIWLGLLTLIANLDLFYIIGRQGWSFEGAPFLRGETYFRPPMNDDVQRDVLLVNAIRRGAGSPFLPGAPMLYQLFWQHLAAGLTAPFHTLSSYGPVVGCLLATSVLFFFLLFWVLAIVRPTFFLRAGPGLAAALFLSVHADLFSYGASWLFKHRAGIEADWSFVPGYLRNFSLKVMALTSPQHVSFFIPVLPLMVDRSMRAGSKRCALEWLLTTLAVLISPVLSIFFFIPLSAVEGLLRARVHGAFRAGLSLLPRFIGAVTAFALHPLVFGFSVLDLFNRPGLETPAWFSAETLAWAQLPILLVACLGTLGVVLSVILVWRGRGLSWLVRQPELLTLLAGMLAFHYLVSAGEIRRHFTMVACVLATLAVVKSLPPLRLLLRSLRMRSALAGLAAVAIGLQAYFIYCYTEKPSYQVPDLAWKDYFEMNGEITRRFPGLPVAAAINPRGLGLDYPVAMEATASFSMPIHLVVHTRVTPKQKALLERVEFAKDVGPYAEALGYRAMIWGPVEDRTWGRRAKERFTKESNLLVRIGEVSLYRLEDVLGRRCAHAERPSEHLECAEAFLRDHWNEEALGHFAAALAVDKKSARAHEGLGQLLSALGRREAAMSSLQRAVDEDPERASARFHLGELLQREGRMEEAEVAYTKAIQLDPDFTDAYNTLANADLGAGHAAAAESLLRRGLARRSDALSLRLTLGRARAAQRDRSGALGEITGLTAASVPRDLRALAYRELADMDAIDGDLAGAIRNYHSALGVNPYDPLTHVKLGYAMSFTGEPEKARLEFRNALHLDPDFQLALAALGEVGG